MRPGEYGRDRVPVTGHALDIPQRLKELDERYFIVLNTRAQKYEIHYEQPWGDTLECVLPYEALDERTIRHVREHDIRRRDELVREMEEHNRRMEEAAVKNYLDEAAERTREAFQYVRRRTDREEIPPELTRTGKERGNG